MAYRISGLSPRPFQHLFGLSDDELEKHQASRLIAGPQSALPDRIELRDAEEGETLLLVHHEHHAASTPFRASGPIFILEGANTPVSFENEVPAVLSTRLLSVRAYDQNGLMVDADVVDGVDLESLIERMFADRDVEQLHVHYARRGCYAALVERAS